MPVTVSDWLGPSPRIGTRLLREGTIEALRLEMDIAAQHILSIGLSLLPNGAGI